MAKAPPRVKLTLSLLRHAKAGRAADGGGDIARDLTSRGQRDAQAMGSYMAATKLAPDLILCSSAALASPLAATASARIARRNASPFSAMSSTVLAASS